MIGICSLCELNAKSNLVMGEGPEDANIMVVGECPGPDENKQIRPFIGRAGKLFRSALKNLCIDENTIYITNIVKCWPQPDLNPKEHHIQACSQLLHKQIEAIKPKLIVGLGRLSSAYLLGEDPKHLRITKISGGLIKKGTKFILPSVHPSYILRNKTNKSKDIEMLTTLIPMLEFV